MKIIFAAGGTGGHINPALAAAGEIRERYPDADILFVGTKDKMEAKLVPQAGFAFEGIAMSGFQRKISVENIIKNIKTIWRVLFSGFAVKRIIKKFGPDVVVGFGGYVSGPIVRKAAKMGKRREAGKTANGFATCFSESTRRRLGSSAPTRPGTTSSSTRGEWESRHTASERVGAESNRRRVKSTLTPTVGPISFGKRRKNTTFRFSS